MNWILSALDHLPEAAASPLAFLAYILTVLAAAFLALNISRNDSQRKLINSIPEQDRSERTREIIGKPIPKTITAEDWLRYERFRLWFVMILVLCASGVVVFAIAITSARVPRDKLENQSKPEVHPSNLLVSKDNELDFIRLRTSRAQILEKLGQPDWTSKDKKSEERRDVFLKKRYEIAIGYDGSDISNIVTIVAMVPESVNIKGKCVIGCEVFSDLGQSEILGSDSSTKFFYYIEGDVGNYTAANYTTVGYFYTDHGAKFEKDSPDAPFFMPPSEWEYPMPVPGDNVDLSKWRKYIHPNGFVMARSDRELESFYFHDWEWDTSVPDSAS